MSHYLFIIYSSRYCASAMCFAGSLSLGTDISNIAETPSRGFSLCNSRIKSSLHCLVPGPVLTAAVFARERAASRYVAPCAGREFPRSAKVPAWLHGRRGGMLREYQWYRFFQMPLRLKPIKVGYWYSREAIRGLPIDQICTRECALEKCILFSYYTYDRLLR